MRNLVLTCVLFAALAGCAMPQQALDATRDAVVADERIVEAYHAATMAFFDNLKAAHVREAKHIVDGLPPGQLTAEVVKEGFDRLVAALDAIEARRAPFVELHHLAQQNNANAKESLSMVSAAMARNAAVQEKTLGLLDTVLQKCRIYQSLPEGQRIGGTPNE